MALSIDFSGKVVLVTGASQGVGLGIARCFQAAGAETHITGTRARADAYDDDLSGFHYHQVDMANPQDRVRLHAELSALDVLVNNAGVALDGEYGLDVFRQTLEVNLIGVMELCLLYRDTLASRGGSIVNVGSTASFVAIKHVPGYTASKTGLLGLTRALADQWAPLNLRVNMVAPGFIKTRMTKGIREKPTVEAAFMKTIPLARWGEVDEVGGAVVFLASDLASYITGASLMIDGGMTLR